MSYEDRFMRKAAAAGPQFASAVKNYLGFNPQDASALLAIASKLSQPGGATMSDNDVVTFARLHPQMHLGDVADVCSKINRAPPARRAELFTGVLTNDRSVLQRGDRVDANDNFKALSGLVEAYTQAEYSDAVTTKLGGTQASPAWRPAEGSVRDLVSRAMTPKANRDIDAAFTAGDPGAEDFVRDRLADKMEQSIHTLHKPEASLHDTLAASFDLHQGEQFATEEFGIEPPGDNA